MSTRIVAGGVSTGAEIKSLYELETDAYTDTKNTKLLGVDTGAADDQTGSEIKTLYEAEANAYTDTKNTKLSGIATGADVTANNTPQSHDKSVHTDRTRETFICDPIYGTFGTGIRGAYLDAASVEAAYYAGKLPKDFVSMISIHVVYSPALFNTANDVILDINMRFGASGETYNIHNNTLADEVVNIDNGNVDTFLLNSSIYANITSNDFFVIKIERDADHVDDDFVEDFCVRGILITYTADM